MRVKNFLFHRVGYDVDPLWPPMKPELFRRIVKAVVKKYQIVSLEEVLSDIKYFEKSKKTLATILFDDGYKDNIEYAAPILKEDKCSASFYVVTDCINRDVPTWTYIIDYLIQNTNRKNIEIDFSYVPESFKRIQSLDINPQIKELKPWMKTLPNFQRLQVSNSIVQQCNDVVTPNNIMMNWSDLKELHSAGFVVGSHTHTHPMLGKLESHEEIRSELVESYINIKQHLGIIPLAISYPIGSFDDRVKRLSKESGYKFGLAVEQRFFETKNEDLFAVPRVELYQESWWKVQARINGIYNRVKSLWK